MAGDYPGLTRKVVIRKPLRRDPGDIRITLEHDGKEVAKAHAVYGDPKKLVPWLRSIYAYGMADIIEGEARTPIGLLEYLEVKEGYRRRGLGRMLISELLDFIRDKKVRAAYLQVSYDVGFMNESILIPFYESFGFEYRGRTPDDLEDPVMVLDM